MKPLLSALLFIALSSCTIQPEGTVVGDCTDRADNDADGLFDCDDDGCFGSPDCSDDTGEADAEQDRAALPEDGGE